MTDHTSTSEALPPCVNPLNTAEGLGNLMDVAFGTASTHLRPVISMIESPDGDSKALVAVSHDGVAPLDPKMFDPWRTNPLRREGTAVMTNLQSLISHVNRFKSPDSALFANDDRARPSLTAVIDYHDRVNDDEGTDLEPRAQFGTHRTVFNFPLSDEWNAWQAQNGKAMSMADFAAFLEDRICDIQEAPAVDDENLPESLAKLIAATGSGKIAGPSTLWQLATSFKVLENSSLKQAVNLASGEGELKFQSEHVDESGQKLIVPSLFLVGIPVFQHGDAFRMAARLRYRHNAGVVKFWYELHRADLVFDTAFKDACDEAQDRTGLPLFYGAPEKAGVIGTNTAQRS